MDLFETTASGWAYNYFWLCVGIGIACRRYCETKFGPANSTSSVSAKWFAISISFSPVCFRSGS